jgi:hypothetical protein
MRERFVFKRVDRPDNAWLARFIAGRAEAEQWHLGRDRAAAPTAGPSAEQRDDRTRWPRAQLPYDRGE